MKRTSKTPLTAQAVGLKYGFRSGLEEKVADQLAKETHKRPSIRWDYEPYKIVYIQPEKKRKYTPDFILESESGRQMYIETKGRFTREDRKKHEWIKNQHPQLDIRFVFSNPNAKIDKRSKTTYAMWCDKQGFKYAKQLIPTEWLDELTDCDKEE